MPKLGNSRILLGRTSQPNPILGGFFLLSKRERVPGVPGFPKVPGFGGLGPDWVLSSWILEPRNVCYEPCSQRKPQELFRHKFSDHRFQRFQSRKISSVCTAHVQAGGFSVLSVTVELPCFLTFTCDENCDLYRCFCIPAWLFSRAYMKICGTSRTALWRMRGSNLSFLGILGGIWVRFVVAYSCKVQTKVLQYRLCWVVALWWRLKIS